MGLQNLENQILAKCNVEWSPKSFGEAFPNGDQYGRTTIMPEIFRGFNTAFLPHWRQLITAAGQQTVIYGVNAGHVIPEDVKVAWMGLAFPNKQQQISEIRFQIGDRKYGRLDLEEIHSYNVPAVIFEEGFIIDEETSFDLLAYVESPDYQRIVMLGAMYYKTIDRVLGNTGAIIV